MKAVKFSVEIIKKKELSLEEREIVEVIVKDSGIGIPKDRLPYIFDRFYQADRVDRSDIEGTGIGLTLAQELVELHSGKIYVESELSKGTTIKVIMLMGINHFKTDEISEAIVEKDSDIEADSLLISKHDFDEEIEDDLRDDTHHKESVLIVDDNADIREFVKEQLEDLFLIYQAGDGLNGIKLATELIPNLIIIDVRMPGMDGFELSKKLKQNTLTSHIPIIILTAKSDQIDKLTGLETGADDYLINPFSPQELIVRVKNLIATRRQLRERYSKTANFHPSDVTESSIDQIFLQKVIKSINDNISNSTYSVDQLANEVAFSVSQLNRKLKALIDQPAGLYIRIIRLEKAGEMLKNKVASVKEIAFAVGFTEQSNFAKSFKKYFGVSPSEFNIEQDQPHK
jgi:DNA-binding response OmpR family regulator